MISITIFLYDKAINLTATLEILMAVNVITIETLLLYLY